jgi:hypothetical protein
MIDEIEITRAGVGKPDGCWIWYSGALRQINVNEGEQGEIHSLHMECRKGEWSLIPETTCNPVLWNAIASRLLKEMNAWIGGRVVV